MWRTILLAVLAAGCGNALTVPTAKFFSGQPVAHWLGELRSTSPKARRHAADVLGNVGPTDPAALPALAAALADPDAGVRAAAVLGLSKNGPAAADALPAVRRVLATDPSPLVRRYAQIAVEQIGGG